jgi:hypothetical protein
VLAAATDARVGTPLATEVVFGGGSLSFRSRPLADIPSIVAERTNVASRIFSDEGIGGNVPGDDRTCGLRGILGMARRDDAHVRSDHHIVLDVEAAKVVEGAILIDEDIAPDAPPAV